MNVKKFYEDTGSNYDSAISIMMNDAFIERMLKKFVDNNSYNAIIEAYESNDIKGVFALSHSFKGVAGNLALTKLFNIASILTEATRDKESVDISKEIELLKSEYQSFIEIYNQANL